MFMNTRKWIFLLVGAVLTEGALAVNWFDGSTVSSDATRLAGGNAQTAAHHADTAEPPVRRDPTPLSTLETGTKMPGEGLARDLADAQDYRQFSLRAVAKPELGGISYANYAQSVCRRYATLHAASGLTDRNSIPYDGKEDSTLYAKRVSYMQRMERRCASFSSNEISYDSALEFAAREVQEKDLHAVLKRRYERAANSGNEKERLQVASEVLATRDPLLLANLTYKFLGGRENGRIGFYLDGTFYPAGTEAGGALQIALDILPCRLGLPCDTTDVNVVQACISASKCFANKEELLTSEVSEEGKRQIERYVARLVQVVDEKDVNAFRRPRP